MCAHKLLILLQQLLLLLLPRAPHARRRRRAGAAASIAPLLRLTHTTDLGMAFSASVTALCTNVSTFPVIRVGGSTLPPPPPPLSSILSPPPFHSHEIVCLSGSCVYLYYGQWEKWRLWVRLWIWLSRPSHPSQMLKSHPLRTFLLFFCLTATTAALTNKKEHNWNKRIGDTRLCSLPRCRLSVWPDDYTVFKSLST